jgi:hypothetical protein
MVLAATITEMEDMAYMARLPSDPSHPSIPSTWRTLAKNQFAAAFGCDYFEPDANAARIGDHHAR